MVNPIPTGQGRNQPLYERHVTKVGQNKVKQTSRKPASNLLYVVASEALQKCEGMVLTKRSFSNIQEILN